MNLEEVIWRRFEFDNSTRHSIYEKGCSENDFSPEHIKNIIGNHKRRSDLKKVSIFPSAILFC